MVRLLPFRLELDHNAPQRRIPDILYRVYHGQIESGSVWDYLSDNLRLSVRPLLEAGPVQLHDNTLAVRVPRAGVAGIQPFFEDKEPLAVVTHGVLFGRNNLAWRVPRRMVRLEGHLEEGASRR